MAPKRNDPCHCGSGKKYKHCHMKADREAELAAEEEAVHLHTSGPTFGDLQNKETDRVIESIFEEKNDLQTDVEPEENDPEVERLNKLYEEFEDADYDETIALLRKSIETNVLDSESAFELFNELYPIMVEQNDRKEFTELVALLKTHQPDVYAEESQWFWSWAVSNALVLQDDEALQAATDELVKDGGQEIEQFYKVSHMLLYHDHRDVLLRALDKHTMDLSSREYFPHVEFELNQKLIDLVIFDYLDTHEPSTLFEEKNIDALCDRLQKYIEKPEDFRKDGLVDFLGLVGGKSTRDWTMDDFAFRKMPKRKESMWDEEDETKKVKVDPAVENLRDLSCEFLHYARTVEDLPFDKSDLARSSIVDYIRERHEGELELADDEPFGFLTGGNNRAKNKSRKVSKKKQAQKKIVHRLLPDPATMDRFLARFFSFMGSRPHEAIICFEMLPAWSRFIQSKGLATEEEVQASLRSLDALCADMIKMAEQNDSDPALEVNMRNWRENAGFERGGDCPACAGYRLPNP